MLLISLVVFQMPFLLSINRSSGMTKQCIFVQLRSYQSPAQSFLGLQTPLLTGPRTVSVISAVASLWQLRDTLRSASTHRSFSTPLLPADELQAKSRCFTISKRARPSVLYKRMSFCFSPESFGSSSYLSDILVLLCGTGPSFSLTV